MGSYEKIVETLRRCAKENDCDGCPYYHEDGYWCDQKSIATDSADEIEALVKINNRFRELLDNRNKDVTELQRNVDELTSQLPKRGKWVGVNPMVDSVQCSICGGQLFSAELETPYCPYCGAKMEVQDGQE